MLVEYEDEDATKLLGAIKLADAATKFKAADMQLRVTCFSSKANKVVELVFKAEDAVQAQDFVKRMKKAVESGGVLAPTSHLRSPKNSVFLTHSSRAPHLYAVALFYTALFLSLSR